MSTEEVLSVLPLPDSIGFPDSYTTPSSKDYTDDSMDDAGENISTTPVDSPSSPKTKPCRSTFFGRFERDPTKTAVWINKSVSPSSKRKYDGAFGKDIVNYSPIKLESPTKVGRSPRTVTTNSGSVLKLRKENSEVSLYDCKAAASNEIGNNQLLEFLTTLFEGVTEVENLTKENITLSDKRQFVVMTQQKRERHANEARVDGKKKRNPDQQTVMGMSATEIVEKYFQPEKIAAACDKLKYSDAQKAELLQQFSNMSSEWLHLIDFGNLGNDAQTSSNLVFGTEEANSQMMVMEETIKRALKNGETVTIDINAKMFKFHIPYEITIQLSFSSGIVKHYTVNPFTRHKPISVQIDCETVHQKAKKRRLEEKEAEKKEADKKSQSSSGADSKLIDLGAFKSDSSDLFGGFSLFSPSSASSTSSISTSLSTHSSTTQADDVVMLDKTLKVHGLESGAV